ncbi:beta-lactamase/transpeptidase-like protein [Pseudovirgaria hyperparasitica]|uniref:Beta-lactamase/transpeptidase-like protein n=1 Tax=Pseudovirgaria hyperparasitica TaxID=470096 RepID=A0A6A6WEF6_9PEZI|nr:beta-lactamase/transpeptidase-like protein [Pseudovirgaria hyperparasitica]KAF2761208.1 beta-lactamase/transpeptidase-like protein [Pseudovirgaria hyperparasitica]
MIFLLFSFLLSASAAFQPCPLPGAAFLPPKHLATDQNFKQLAVNLTKKLDRALNSGQSSYGPVQKDNTAYSVSVFAVDNPDLLSQWHHTPDMIKNSSFGVQTVDANSVYRIASVSKLVTVYALLASIGDQYWHRPVTDFVPELQQHVEEDTKSALEYVQWDQVTLSDLASEISGVTRDFIARKNDISFIPASVAQMVGLPALSPDDLPPCLLNATGTVQDCDRTEFFASIDTRQPIFPSGLKAAYSNTAFLILGYAMESITGRSFGDILDQSIIEPLSLNRTFYSKPEDSMGVIPSTPWESLWNLVTALPASGGMYSSSSDLAVIGRSILSSELLTPATTRSWLKPDAFTTSVNTAVGKSWEIYRFPLYEHRNVDAYTKSGSLGAYTSNIILLPEFGVGYSVLTAGRALEAPVTRTIAESLIPGLEEIARLQSVENLVGTFRAMDGGLNSSMIFTSDAGLPGLGVSSFISDGKDVVANLGSQFLGSGQGLSLRLYPAELEQDVGDGTRRIGFRIAYEVVEEAQNSPFAACATWFGVDGLSYGRHGVDQVVFTVDENGRALSVEPLLLDVVLTKVGS